MTDEFTLQPTPALPDEEIATRDWPMPKANCPYCSEDSLGEIGYYDVTCSGCLTRHFDKPADPLTFADRVRAIFAEARKRLGVAQ